MPDEAILVVSNALRPALQVHKSLMVCGQSNYLKMTGRHIVTSDASVSYEVLTSHLG
jgi:hypothetical protein